MIRLYDRPMAGPQGRAFSVAQSAVGLALVALLTGCGTSTPEATDDQGDRPAAGQLDPAAAAAALLGPWRANPVPLWPALLETVARACSTSLQPFPPVPLVAVDARGMGRLQAMFAGPAGIAACSDMTIDKAGTVSAMGGGMTGTDPAPGPLDDHALVSWGVSSSGGGGGAITSSVIMGQAGAGVARVVVLMPGQVQMTATLANGWYLFWWPAALPVGTKVIGLDGIGAQVAISDP